MRQAHNVGLLSIFNMMQQNYLIIIVGPTASGKTDLAVKIANKLNTEIISADSRQIYREMSIGTAIPDATQLAEVKHHFIGHISVQENYNASMYELEVLNMLDRLFLTKQAVIMTGGSGLYINAVCKGIDDFPTVDPLVRERVKSFFRETGMDGIRDRLLQVDPVYHNKVDLNNPKRVIKALEIYEMTGKPYSSFLTGSIKHRDFRTIKIGLDIDRRILYERINKRVDKMLSLGLVREVKSLYRYKDTNALNTVGYKEIIDFIDNRITLMEATDLIKRHTRQYARRQLTWFRRDQEIRWFSKYTTTEILNYISESAGLDLSV